MISAQSLLAERRACVQEQRTAKTTTERQLLQFRIDEIDRELHERSEKAWRPSDTENAQ